MFVNIKGVLYRVPENSNLISVYDFFQYLSVLKEYHEFLRSPAQNDVQAINEEFAQEFTYLAKMVSIATKAPYEDVLDMSIQDIMYIHKACEEMHIIEKPFEGSFEFDAFSENERENMRQELAKLGAAWFMSKKGRRLWQDLRKKTCKWVIGTDIRNEKFSQFIELDGIRKQVTSLTSKDNNLAYYENIPKIIALLARKENEPYKAELSEEREQLFRGLPLTTAVGIAGFFLRHAKTFTKSLLFKASLKIAAKKR